MTVWEYVKKFNELSQYAPRLIDTEVKKNEKFIDGLRHHLSKPVLPAESEPLNKVVDLALKFKRKEQTFQVEKSARAKTVENYRDTQPQT